MTPRQLEILRAELRALQRARRLAGQLRAETQTAADRAVRLEGLVYRAIRCVVQAMRRSHRGRS
jgi:hypothetical protein